jgi:uncharacterized membrane protein YkoI
LSHLLLTLAIAGALGLPPAVHGDDPAAKLEVAPAQTVQRSRSTAQRRMSLDAATAMVRERFGGRVIRAETRRRNDGSVIHEIRLLLDNGRVRTVLVDAESGRIIN